MGGGERRGARGAFQSGWGRGRGGRGAFQSVRGDTGTIDRVQNGVEGAEVRGPSAPGIQCLLATHYRYQLISD